MNRNEKKTYNREVNRLVKRYPAYKIGIMLFGLAIVFYILGFNTLIDALLYLAFGVAFIGAALLIVASGQAKRDLDLHGRGKATKTCPACAEEVMIAAIKCKHCGESLT
jgi:hypothetical protein